MSDTPRGQTYQYFGKTPSGVEMALTLDVDGKTPAEIAAYLKSVDAELKAAGFTRSDRLDKPAGGWGGKGQQPRAETPPPAGIVRPDHCATPMRYMKYRKEGAPGAPARNLDPGWRDMWVCAKDKQCEDVTSGKSEKAAANFDMKAEAAATPAEAPSNGAVPHDRPMTGDEMIAFWSKTREMGYQRGKVFEVAAEVIHGQGPSMKEKEWMELGKLAVHRVFTRLKEMHTAEAQT